MRPPGRPTDFSNRAAGVAALLLFAGLAWLLYGDAIGNIIGSPAPAAGAAAQVTEPLEIETKGGLRRFAVEVARTQQQQMTGLMYRTKLADTAGMLFPHPAPAELTMWMRNTYIPLDMLFIGQDGRVVRIEEMTEPMSERVISSEVPATAVLELAGGAAKRLGIATGDLVRHPHFLRPKP